MDREGQSEALVVVSEGVAVEIEEKYSDLGEISETALQEDQDTKITQYKSVGLFPLLPLHTFQSMSHSSQNP